MDQAIYHAGTDKIYAVRGQWLLKFNASTASLESALKFVSNISGPSCIVAIGANLYIGTTFSPSCYAQVPPFFNQWLTRDIYVVDTATFTVSGRLNMDTSTYLFENIFSNFQAYYNNGYNDLVTDGTNLYGTVNAAAPFKVDPSNVAGTFDNNAFGPSGGLVYEPLHDRVWMTDITGPNVRAFSTTPIAGDDWNNSGTVSPFISGITFAATAQKIYFVQGDFNIGMVDASAVFPIFTDFPFTLFDLTRIDSTANRVRAVNGLPSNPLNDKVLVPTWDDDAVVVWDPATDTVDSVKTGFTSPVDVISTPTKNWAVQSGVTPFREIT